MTKINNLVEDAYRRVEQEQQKVASDMYRLQFHLMPPVGLLNDPNGFIQIDEVYHVFYQWNPFETAHGAKFWGHFTSTDLVNWTTEPIALAPDQWYDKNGCYSGSAIEHDGKMYLFYTGNVKEDNGERSTYQCMAVSEDGISFEKKGPVIHLPKGYTAHFRDPKVWKSGNEWLMVLGAQNLKHEGEAVLYRSDNLFEWEFLGPAAGSQMNELEEFGYMWECPDLFQLDGHDVLIVSPQGLEPEGDHFHNLYQSGYFIGKLDPQTKRLQHGTFTELDRGFDFYAPQTTLDSEGRRLLIAWMGITDEMEKYQPTIEHNWIHALTIPRELKIVNNKIYQKPATELKALRKNEVRYKAVCLEAGIVKNFSDIQGDSLEMQLDFNDSIAGIFEMEIRDNIKISYHSTERLFTLERKNLKDGKKEFRRCALEKLHKLHIFLDTSSIEIFLNDGEEVCTARFFAKENDKCITFYSDQIETFDLSKWGLK
ncbi:glycoside hydrolase family 32 protein [Lederbergia lenta]|uniref:glycoside hydrolase family 32 protein n=1 Tax=Lederbergia lenta TaxID=1467 RepID=UPI00203FC8A8|nr:sucrose-6-phosphate hydrolase [Lederbergia lenta]MCM3112130.1 sucrose-6-phosphate hydrolase [Lederbergia lenta]